jgi:hypothetical protein
MQTAHENKCAVIVIDTGFSLESIAKARHILATVDLSTGRSAVGEPFLDLKVEADRKLLEDFAGDPLNHGSLVLEALVAEAPELPVVLVRAYSDDVRLIRTGWSDGKISRPGWTDAYLAVVDFCAKRGYATVTNCSFGGYTHAMDGTGWEAHSLRQVTGQGKPGHIVIAGAGAGNRRALHASWRTEPATHSDVRAWQRKPTTYNFWCGAGAAEPEASDWSLEVFLNGQEIAQYSSQHITANIWNQRKQLTFTVPGEGLVVFRVCRFSCDATAGGAEERAGDSDDVWNFPAPSTDVHRFDMWINHQDDAEFLDHVDETTIAEPAVFPEVIAAGLQSGSYSPNQADPQAKPEILLPGEGPISFRLPRLPRWWLAGCRWSPGSMSQPSKRGC